MSGNRQFEENNNLEPNPTSFAHVERFTVKQVMQKLHLSHQTLWKNALTHGLMRLFSRMKKRIPILTCSRPMDANPSLQVALADERDVVRMPEIL